MLLDLQVSSESEGTGVKQPRRGRVAKRAAQEDEEEEEEEYYDDELSAPGVVVTETCSAGNTFATSSPISPGEPTT